MLRKIISFNESYELMHDESEKTVYLTNKDDNSIHLTAKFFQDTSDGATLLSDFRYQSAQPNQENLSKLTADMVSDYLSRVQDKCKLFCFPGEYGIEFLNSTDYRSNQIDRLMLRENKILAGEIKSFSDKMVIDRLDGKFANESDILQIIVLLKQTYWAENAGEAYIKKALENSVFLVMRDETNKIIGLVRYTTNNHFAYISDMVVDKDWRKQGIATILMQKLSQLIDEKYEFTALISAREGDGKDAASKLYGDKFGFVDYDKSHVRNLYFRYIKLIPTNTDKLSIAPDIELMFSNNNTFRPYYNEQVKENRLENTFKS